MNVKKIAIATLVSGALSGAALGLGAGVAQADHDDWVVPIPVPVIPDVDVKVPPGHVGQWTGIPPGQLKKIAGPFGVPPGHW